MKKSTKTQQFGANTLEALRSIPSGVVESAVKDVAQETVKGLWEQLLGAGEYAKSPKKHAGDLSEGQELNLQLFQQETVQKTTHMTERIAAIDYHREIVEGGKREEAKLSYALETKVEEIIIELKQLVNSSQELAVTYKEIAVDQRMQNPGKYHIAFFELMLKVVREARQKIEDSGAWLQAMKSKKGQKSYWNMFETHGTSFGLSNERVVATQSG